MRYTVRAVLTRSILMEISAVVISCSNVYSIYVRNELIFYRRPR
jgi:hypothetical protein